MIRCRSKPITDVEKEILFYISQGHGIKKTAKELGLKCRMVEGRLANLRRYFSVKNNTHLIAYLIRSGLL